MKPFLWGDFMALLADDLSHAFPAARVNRVGGDRLALRYESVNCSSFVESVFGMTVKVSGGKTVEVSVSPAQILYAALTGPEHNVCARVRGGETFQGGKARVRGEAASIAWVFAAKDGERCARLAKGLAEMASERLYLESLGSEIERCVYGVSHEASVFRDSEGLSIFFEHDKAEIRVDLKGAEGGRGLAGVYFGPSRVFHPHLDCFGSREGGRTVSLPNGRQYEGHEREWRGKRGGAQTACFFEIPDQQNAMISFIEGITEIVRDRIDRDAFLGRRKW